jgi:CHAT domain-containing protein
MHTAWISLPALIIWLLAVVPAMATTVADDDSVSRLVSRGEALRMQGKFPAARDALEAAVAGSAQASPLERARARAALGALLFFSRDSEGAAARLGEALLLARESGDDDVLAGILNHLGMLAVSQRDLVLARRHYDESLAVAKAAGNHATVAAAALNRARIEHGSRKAPFWRIARDAAGRVVPEADKVIPLVDIGRQATEALAGREAEALSRAGITLQWIHAGLEEARQAAGSSGNQRHLSMATGQMGALYESQGRNEDAVSLTLAAIEAANAGVAEDLGVRWQWQMGRLQRRLGRSDEALLAYRKALRHLDTVRLDIPVQYVGGRSSFRETLEPVYLGAADIMLETSARRSDPAKAEALLDEALYTMELLKAAEINDFFHDSCAARPAMREPWADLTAGTAVLYPVILPERLELIILTSGQKRRVSVDVSGDTLKARAREFATSLRPTGDGLQAFEASSRRLHGWLIEPIKHVLEAHAIKTLLFVPDGPLRLVPLAALFDGEHFLVEQYAVATLPGLSQFEVAKGHEGADRVLLAGVSESVQGFDDLPGVESELTQLDRQFKARLLLNEGFNLETFRAEMQQNDYNIVHIASHGEFGGTPERSFLLTYDRKLDMNDLLATLSARKQESPIDLLSLSACHTAEGDDRAPLGLGGVAIKAGVQSALGSLWMVSDRAAERMIPMFYAGLEQRGLGKAEALRQAQASVLNDTDMKHPFFWAPFIMIGNAY